MAGPTAPTTAPTAIRAGGPLLSPVRRNIIFTALVFGVLVAATGQTIVVPALPTIVAELGSTVDQSWAVTSYLLGGTVVVVVAGKLGDLLGRNRVLLGSVVVFVVGSVLCGLSQTMTMLAISRALQGVGAGAISVTAYALAAEVVPLRDRGRYQGVLGAVFGVNTVTGPLLGGWLTDYLSWRWAFWINVPVSIAVLTVAATAVPALARPPKPVIDYLGILVIAVATTALIMATSWGGTTYAWGSATIVGLLIGAAVALGFFVWLEGRAAAAILPPRLFGSPVFAVCCVLSFVVGFAMLGALTFVPIYLGYVDGASATASGLRTLPMVIGLLIASTGTGVLVGRTGRYKIFPVAGMALMAVAFLLMSQMDEWTPPLLQSLYLVVLGAGIGLSMQVLVLIVQNTSSFEDLGVATSGVTFFRVVGASFGTATFGALFVNFLDRRLGSALTSGAVPSRQCHLRLSCISCPRAWPPRSCGHMPSRSPRCSFARSRSRWSVSSWRCCCERYRSPTSTMTPTTSATGSVCPEPNRRRMCWKSRFGVCCRTGCDCAILRHNPVADSASPSCGPFCGSINTSGCSRQYG